MRSPTEEGSVSAGVASAGRAGIRFAPAQTGQVQGTLAFWGSTGYAPSETTVSFDIQQPAFTYVPTPVGLQAWWGRSTLILVPFAMAWFVYLSLLWLAVRVRRAGAAASAPSDIAATSSRRER